MSINLILMALWALLLIGGFIIGTPEAAGRARIPYPATILSSLTLVALAWQQRRAFRVSKGTDVAAYAWSIALGMTFGFLGDLGMASGIVLLAILFFGIGHVFYIRGMVAIARARTLGHSKRRLVCLILALAVGLTIWWQLVLNGNGSPASRSPLLIGAALGYTLLLASTAGIAAGLAACHLRFMPLAIGAALFLASDAVIAARMFKPDVFLALPDWIRGDLVWLTYGPAQLLIVTSVMTGVITGPFSNRLYGSRSS